MAAGMDARAVISKRGRVRAAQEASAIVAMPKLCGR